MVSTKARRLSPGPAWLGKAADIPDGEAILFRGFTGTCIHSFSARVKAKSHTPLPHWMLSDVKHVEARDMRGSVRVPVRLVGTLSVDEEEVRAQTVLITDLSLGGASVSTAASTLTAPGRKVRLDFTLRAAGMKAKFTLDGRIGEDPDARSSEPFHNVGVAFDGYGEREALLLRTFVYERLLESATMRPGNLPRIESGLGVEGGKSGVGKNSEK